VVKVLRYQSEGPGIDPGIFSVASDNSMCLGSTQPLKMSTRILLGVLSRCVLVRCAPRLSGQKNYTYVRKLKTHRQCQYVIIRVLFSVLAET
jgi:hypothetical protein